MEEKKVITMENRENECENNDEVLEEVIEKESLFNKAKRFVKSNKKKSWQQERFWLLELLDLLLGQGLTMVTKMTLLTALVKKLKVMILIPQKKLKNEIL